jgi:hypothetical protein
MLEIVGLLIIDVPYVVLCYLNLKVATIARLKTRSKLVGIALCQRETR